MFDDKWFQRQALLIVVLALFIPCCLDAIPFFHSSWKKDQFQSQPQQPPPHESDHEHVRSQLANMRCPARSGQDLMDYWRCLWHTSLTPMGMEQERRGRIESYVEAAHLKPLGGGTKSRQNLKRGDSGKRRKRRQIPNQIEQVRNQLRMLNQEFPDIARVLAFSKDYQSVVSSSDIVPLRECQRSRIKAGLPFTSFLQCLLRKSSTKYSDMDIFEVKPPRQINITYDSREFLVQNFPHSWNTTNTRLPSGPAIMSFPFTPLDNEDVQGQFKGADPYLSEQISPYRYRYKNLDSSQRQPGWSYVGLDGTANWHQLNLEKLYLPVKIGVVSESQYKSDLAQTYPGIGEISDNRANDLLSPLDYKWNKDSGYHMYTRYLLPLLVDSDLLYYKSKGDIKESETVKPDYEVLDIVLAQLNSFLNLTSRDNETSGIGDLESSLYMSTYKDFIYHYYNLDYTSIAGMFKGRGDAAEKELWDIVQTARNLMTRYVEAVQEQVKCMSAMVKESPTRKDEVDLDEVFAKVENDGICKVANDENDTRLNDSTTYVLDRKETLRDLYKSYFDRKEARQRYTLPVYPHKFPLCEHDEPSPINIVTTNGRKSSLRDYILGEAGYRLNRFFMALPPDGSPLLYVGILRGERLDHSSVELYGGAVKGQNLTFQYMFFKFSHNHYKFNGSEHQIDGVGAPMEIQMLFTISGSTDPVKYWHILSRVQNQLFQFRGKLVIMLSFLVDVIEKDEDLVAESKKIDQDPFLFEPLAQAAYHFRKDWEFNTHSDSPRGYVSTDYTFRLSEFFPQRTSKFYTYRGSLTWPPCFGYVIWSVFEKRLLMSKRQFEQFAKIPAFGISDHGLIADNYRSPDDIYVAKEHLPNVDFATRQALIRARTVDRYILEGEHEQGQNDEAEAAGVAIVDKFGYYDRSDNEIDSKATTTLESFRIRLLFAVAVSALLAIL